MTADDRPPRSASGVPMTEEEILAVTVGERKPLNGAITLVPYDPQWPTLFEREAQRIRAALGDKVLLLEHVGSTSVPGLMAKPVVDMVLAVADSADENAYVPALKNAGYRLRIREPQWHGHRLFKSPDIAGNLHVFSVGCPETERMLRFRNWLRAHDEDRELYQRIKRELAGRTWKYTQNYADAKSDVVEEILARARS